MINIFDIEGMIKTVSTIPTYTPTKLYDQAVIYVNGTTKTLYIYSNTQRAWYSVTLT